MPKMESFVRVDTDSSQWEAPVKRIHGAQDIPFFHRSVALHNIQDTIVRLCELVSLKDVPNGVLKEKLVEFEKTEGGTDGVVDPGFENEQHPPGIRAVLKLLDFLQDLKTRCPPLEGPRRFGNMAFRGFHDTLASEIDEVLGEALRPLFTGQFEGFLTEIRYYFLGSLGSRQRLDYGTGHELSFLAFFASLIMTRIITPQELTGEHVLIVFGKYYDLVKELILTYTLEPAGSHGVWGLDDHFHLIYILGAAQLVDFAKVMRGEETDRRMRDRLTPPPSSVLSVTGLSQYRTRNLYFNAVAFIRKVKSGPFHEHSPMLYDINRTKPWEKIAKGMVKMYYAEVLSKFPVVQHFYFGGVLFPWKDRASGAELPDTTPDETSPAEEFQEPSTAERAMNDNHTRRELEMRQLSRRTQPRKQETIATKAPWAK